MKIILFTFCVLVACGVEEETDYQASTSSSETPSPTTDTDSPTTDTDNDDNQNQESQTQEEEEWYQPHNVELRATIKKKSVDQGQRVLECTSYLTINPSEEAKLSDADYNAVIRAISAAEAAKNKVAGITQRKDHNDFMLQAQIYVAAQKQIIKICEKYNFI